MISRHVIEIREYERIGEENRVVEKRLRGHQRQAHQRAAPMHRKERMEDFAERRVVTRAQTQAGERLVHWRMSGAAKARFDVLYDRGGFRRFTVCEQPARA